MIKGPAVDRFSIWSRPWHVIVLSLILIILEEVSTFANMVIGSGPDVLLHCSVHKYLSFFWPRYKLIFLDTSLLAHSCIVATWAGLCQVWRGREAESRSRKGLFKNVECWASTLVQSSIRKTLIRTIDPYWVAVARQEDMRLHLSKPKRSITGNTCSFKAFYSFVFSLVFSVNLLVHLIFMYWHVWVN